MSKFKKILGSVTSMLGLGAPDMPTPAIPAAPAPVPRDNAGANVVIGTSDPTRASGSGTAKKRLDPLGSLGLGGLSI